MSLMINNIIIIIDKLVWSGSLGLNLKITLKEMETNTTKIHCLMRHINGLYLSTFLSPNFSKIEHGPWDHWHTSCCGERPWNLPKYSVYISEEQRCQSDIISTTFMLWNHACIAGMHWLLSCRFMKILRTFSQQEQKHD